MKKHRAEGRHRFFTPKNAARARYGLAWTALCEWCNAGDATPERIAVFQRAKDNLEHDAKRLIGRMRTINGSR